LQSLLPLKIQDFWRLSTFFGISYCLCFAKMNQALTPEGIVDP
jgi:hypothetical protein